MLMAKMLLRRIYWSRKTGTPLRSVSWAVGLLPIRQRLTEADQRWVAELADRYGWR